MLHERRGSRVSVSPVVSGKLDSVPEVPVVLAQAAAVIGLMTRNGMTQRLFMTAVRYIGRQRWVEMRF